MSRTAPPLPFRVAGQRLDFQAVPAISTHQGLAPGASSDVAMTDWDDLLSAVKSRLRLTVGELLDALPHGQLPDAAHRVQASVLECASALDQLQLTLTHELHRRQLLELEVFEAQAALTQARAELSATQADELRARYLDSHDSLTSLPNHNGLQERLSQVLAVPESSRQGLALLYLDLDGLKSINDQHGRQTGDDILRIVAARLTRSIRAADMVSRVGGDEFVCLLADVPSREQLSHLACKTFDTIGAPMKIGQLKLSIHASIGIAICPNDGASPDALLKSADDAMCYAKRQKTGYAFFAEAVEADSRVTE